MHAGMQHVQKCAKNGPNLCPKAPVPDLEGQNFPECRGCAPERRVVKQAVAKQAAAKLLKLGQMKEKANGCQHKASYLTGLICG